MLKASLVVLVAGLTLAMIGCSSGTSPSEVYQMQGDWELQELGSVSVPNPERYSIRFLEEGTVDVGADCNGCGGIYQTNGNTINIQLQFCTAAFCGPASLDNEFKAALENATSYSRQGSNLILEYSGGRMVFEVGSQ